MALNPACVGRSYAASAPYQVGREKVREFARALGETSAVCLDLDAARAAGYPDLVAPPTFAIVISLKAGEVAIADPEVGIDYTRVVHGEQRFEYTRPICAGDELVCVTSVNAARSVAGNDILTLRGDIATVAGEHVVTTYSVLVARGEAS